MATTTEFSGSPIAEAVPEWTGRVLPLEKGAAVATSERRAAQVKEGGEGMSVRIPVRDILQILGAILAIAAVVWTLRSDIRDIKTSQAYEFQLIREKAEQQTKTQDERWQTQTETNRAMSAKMEMQRLTLDDIELALAKAGIYTAPKKGGG